MTWRRVSINSICDDFGNDMEKSINSDTSLNRDFARDYCLNWASYIMMNYVQGNALILASAEFLLLIGQKGRKVGKVFLILLPMPLDCKRSPNLLLTMK